MTNDYRMCRRCIMDTTDPWIQFDENGVCNHCHKYDELVQSLVRTGEAGQQELNRLVNEIKAKGKNKKYDCVIGVSGGVDSTFAAYKVKELGLRPLAVHMDNGWNSELAVRNIEYVLKKLNIDLYTYVLDWEEFKDLQLAFLKASVSDAEMPTDHAIVAVLYQVAAEQGISYIIRGGNVVTEGVLPLSWSYGGEDWRYISGIHKRFGGVKLKSYPHYSLSKLFYYIMVKKLEGIRILNYIDYIREDAMQLLQDKLGWRYYGGKHYESIYTRFFQGYILPKKFNIDKRKAHLSALILSGQMTREAALEQMKHSPYPEGHQMEDREYVAKKLGVTVKEFDEIMALPPKTFLDYPSYYPLRKNGMAVVTLGKKLGILPKHMNL